MIFPPVNPPLYPPELDVCYMVGSIRVPPPAPGPARTSELGRTGHAGRTVVGVDVSRGVEWAPTTRIAPNGIIRATGGCPLP